MSNLTQNSPTTPGGDGPSTRTSRSHRSERKRHLLLLVGQVVAIPVATAMGMMGDILYNTVGPASNAVATAMTFFVMLCIAVALSWANWTSYKNMQRRYEHSTHSVADLRETLEALLSTTRSEERRAEAALAQLRQEISEATVENETLRQRNEKLQASLRKAMQALDEDSSATTDDTEGASLRERARQTLDETQEVEERPSVRQSLFELCLGLVVLQSLVMLITFVVMLVTGMEFVRFVNLAFPLFAALGGLGFTDDEVSHWSSRRKSALVITVTVLSLVVAVGVTFSWIPWAMFTGQL